MNRKTPPDGAAPGENSVVRRDDRAVFREDCAVPREDCVVPRERVVTLLSASAPDQRERLRTEAERVMLRQVGDRVHYRGLIEFSNICRCDCRYCGIRKSNGHVHRFSLSQEEILEAARSCAGLGYGSVTLQSGERRDPTFIDFVCRTVEAIKRETRSETLPEGLGITLCVGEQSEAVYRRLFASGAHRYLLRIETSSPALFRRLHPAAQRLEERIGCLESLRAVGFQVGTGVMIGLPGQTVADLADDVLFFRRMDADMIGMGPFITHPDTPMGNERTSSNDELLRLSLNMIAATRIVLSDVNIAATTALQAIHPFGREAGLRYGANVLMPLATPERVRADYLLYRDKPCVEEEEEACSDCLLGRTRSTGREVELDAWGDSPHFRRKRS